MGFLGNVTLGRDIGYGMDCRVVQRVVNPRFFTYMAFYDVASNVYQAVIYSMNRRFIQRIVYPRFLV